jgi:ComF family protein
LSRGGKLPRLILAHFRFIREAVFSSSEDRIRAVQARSEAAGWPIAFERGSQGLAGFFKRSAESVFSVLFPSDCRICALPLLNISRLPVCPDCLDGITAIKGSVCSICGERVLSSYAFPDDDGWVRCPMCRRIERPFERAVAYGSYEGGLRELVHLLKFSGVRPAAPVLGGMLAQALAGLESEFEQEKVLVIPVPLFKVKRRQRGFNQAELIARAALKRYDSNGRLQLVPDVLLRTRDTHSQIGLTSHQRRENLRGAFKVARAALVTGREVVLVDDVYTTGTTAMECSRVLRRAGASKVWVATAARTMKEAGFKVAKWESDKVGAA